MMWRLWTALALCGAVAAGMLWSRTGSATAPPSPPPRPAPGTFRFPVDQWATLDIRTVGTGHFRTVLEADAQLAVDDDLTVPVFAPVTGRVVALRAAPGQHVRKGEVLATIAGNESAQAASDLAAGLAAQQTAAAQLEVARANERRLHAAMEAGGSAEKDWLQARADLAAAQASREAAAAALAAARTRATAVGLEATDAASPRPADLVSPVDGVVVQRQLANGQFVAGLASGASTPLFTVSDLRRIWVLASVPEADAPRVHAGQAAEVLLLADAGGPRRAAISWVSPLLDPVSRRLTFRIELANAEGSLKPQMTARVRVVDDRGAAAVAVPSDGIVIDGEQTHCYVVTGDRTVTLRPVRTGRREAGLTEILSGLRPGERVVASGALFVDAAAASDAP